MNLRRLNHILIPTTKAQRDRFRQSPSGRFILRWLGWMGLFTEAGIGAWVLWLVAGSFSLNVGTTQFYFLWSALTGLLVGSLVLARRFALSQVSLTVDVPKRVAVGVPATFTVHVKNRGNGSHASVRVHTPFLPWDGLWQRKPTDLRALLPGERIGRTAEAVFSARGPHHLDPFRASAALPLGLSHGPAIESEGVRFLVVPRIAPVTGFDMPLAHRYQPGGVALASNTGESRELIGVRPYRPGDPLRDLHAATWARVGEPVVREYRQEYFTRVGIVVDTDIPPQNEAAFETVLSLTAGLVSHFSRGEALVDLLVFGDAVHRLMLGRQLGFLDQALDLLACVEPGPPWSLERLQQQTAPHLGALSSMVLVSLAWDDQRRAFGDWIAARGVGFRAVRVAPKPNGPVPIAPDRPLTVIAANDVENSKGLVL